MPSLKNKISVVIITLNEADNIEDCIIASKQFSDDIIVVDSNSDDDTRSIAKNLGARVFEHSWDGYGAAKNFGASKAMNPWIMSLDADERPDEEMVASLCNIDLDKNTIYGFRRLNYIGSQVVHHGEWNPDIKYRLYHKDITKWSKEAVHESLMVEKWHSRATLPGLLLHYSFRDLEELEQRLDQYALLGAKSMAENGQSMGFLHPIKPWFRFFRSYYLKGGFKDGDLGYQVAQANAKALKKKYRYLKKILKT